MESSLHAMVGDRQPDDFREISELEKLMPKMFHEYEACMQVHRERERVHNVCVHNGNLSVQYHYAFYPLLDWGPHVNTPFN